VADSGPLPFFVVVALAGILSGIFLFTLSMVLFHIFLQRRKAKAKARGAHGQGHHQASSSSSPSSRRRSRRSRSDSESDLTFEGAEEGDEEEEEEEEKMKMKNGGRGSGPRASSLYLEPNQPLYVDVDVESVESESDDHRGPAAHAGMQFILTPPTPRR
jgi:hypothetical protein